ncbi:MAG: hypothetical protein ACI8UO_003121 [Verrucomicrobiales bacterium]|jgi:hypothetical protein
MKIRVVFALLALPIIAAADPVEVVLKPADEGARPAAQSKGFSLTETSFDNDESMPKGLQNASSGTVFSSFAPGNVWSGKRPRFVENEVVPPWGGQQLPNTDVFEVGDFTYAHFGSDHYQTQLVLVLNAKRKTELMIDCRELGDISRIVWDADAETLFFTTLEGNLGDAEDAILHAFHVKTGKPLWRTKAAIARGDFLLYQNHILCHYGFTAQDDFVNVIDRGSGKVLKKQRVKTAASHLIRMDDAIVAPCYQGVYEFSFSEK